MEMMDKSKITLKVFLVKMHHSSIEATSLRQKGKGAHNLDKAELAVEKHLVQGVICLELVQIQQMGVD
jgi:hypothetical protein